MEYPFKFQEILLTDKVLDVIGFTEYWAGAGDYGDRRLNLGGEGPYYNLMEIDEIDDPECGYGYGKPQYCPCHYIDSKIGTVYFLHELYEGIALQHSAEQLEVFVEKLKTKGVNMYYAIESYLKYKNEIK